MIREYLGSKPQKVKCDLNWTVKVAEVKYAKSKGKNPQSARFTVNGQPLPQNQRISALGKGILDGQQIIDTVPEHPVGQTSLPPTLFSSQEVVIKNIAFTDLNRIRAELVDLPYKKGYGKDFYVTVNPNLNEPLLYPVLHLKIFNPFYDFQLNLLGYPQHITGCFTKAIPPCPQHGGKSPHVFSDGTMCWDLERDWTPSMTLYEDFIQFLFKTLYYPREHFGCFR